MNTSDKNYSKIQEIVERCLRSVLPAARDLPSDEEDWVESGLLDSMGHVEFMLSVEKELNSPNLFSNKGIAAPQSIRAAVEIVLQAIRERANDTLEEAWQGAPHRGRTGESAGVAGWGTSLGSEIVSVNQVEREFGLADGALKDRAGIESVRRAIAGQDEISLAKGAAHDALRKARVSAKDVNWIIATSETFLGFPSFGASMHSALLAPETCNVLDIGGGCVGLLNCLVVANALLGESAVKKILVVSSEVHSRIFNQGKVPGEFGGLFGDGASAFVLQRTTGDEDKNPYSVQASVGSCAGSFSSVLQVRPLSDGSISLRFDGEALAHAAVDLIAKIICELEAVTGVLRSAVGAFALHQPNPRLTEIILRAARIPIEKAPLVAMSCGNLGGSTCGVALCMALDTHGQEPRNERGPIFAASVGPGMLWTGVALR